MTNYIVLCMNLNYLPKDKQRIKNPDSSRTPFLKSRFAFPRPNIFHPRLSRIVTHLKNNQSQSYKSKRSLPYCKVAYHFQEQKAEIIQNSI